MDRMQMNEWMKESGWGGGLVLCNRQDEEGQRDEGGLVSEGMGGLRVHVRRVIQSFDSQINSCNLDFFFLLSTVSCSAASSLY